MTHSISSAFLRTRHIVVAALVSVLLAAALSVAVSPSTASAASGDGRCTAGEFCLGWGINMAGGVYDNPYNSDYKLYDNWFVGNGAIVDNNSYSTQNKKSVDVAVFDGSGYSTSTALPRPGCIYAGRGINFPTKWKDRVSSWTVVTRSVCNSYEVLAGPL